MPIFSWKLRASEITANLNLFKQASTNHLHPLLWEGFQFPYEELLNSSELCTPNYAVTYYLQTILALSMAQYEQSDDDAEEKIIDSLLLNNFNSPVFVEKLLIYYTKIYTANELIETQIICWKTLLQHIGRMLQHEHEVLYNQLPTINIQLSKGIEEIIKALELRQANESNIDGLIPSIQTNLTLSQLAVLLRLMIESGLIQTNNNSAFFKTAVILFRTRKPTDVSPKSLSTKYYCPNQAATTIIKDYLIMMLNNSKKLGC